MSKYNKEKLENLLLTQNLSYEAVGRIYGVTGNAVKKAAVRLGIDLPARRKINPKEHFNKDSGKKRYCLNCNKELEYSSKKYCSSKCQHEFLYKEYIKKWKSGETNGISGRCEVSNHIRHYLLEKYNYSCQICGWNKINQITGLVPLQVHHIDGNCTNNKEENLQLLCPNCHSLTDTFGNLNSGSKRTYRTKINMSEKECSN